MTLAPLVGPVWLVALCALAGVLVGLLLWRELRGHGYRLDDEEHLPHRPTAWLVPVHAGLWALLAARFGQTGSEGFLGVVLVVTTAGLALTVIDLDVHRLPLGLTRPLTGIVLVGLALAAALAGDWAALRRALLCGALAWLALLVLAVLAAAIGSPLGMGDVTLTGIIGMVTGWLAWWGPLVAVYAAFVLAGLYAAARLLARRGGRRDAIAFGPWLLAGCLVALLVDVDLMGL